MIDGQGGVLYRLRTLPIHTKLTVVSILVTFALVTLPTLSWQRDAAFHSMNDTLRAIFSLDNTLLTLQHSLQNSDPLADPNLKTFITRTESLKGAFQTLDLPLKGLTHLTALAQKTQGGAPQAVFETRAFLRQLTTEVRAAVHRREHKLNILLGVVSGGFSIAFIVTAIALTRSISIPIRKVTAIMTQVADGDLTVHIPDEPRTDEIGDMYRALHVFKRGAVIRRRTQEELRQAHDGLEQRVDERTRALRDEIHERRRIEQEMVSAREQAESANRAKSLFLANMSHELRTPLNAIIGYSEMLREDAVSAKNTRLSEDLDKIHNAGKHLLGVFNEILDLSKIETGQVKIQVENFAVLDVLNAVVNTVQPLITANANTLVIDADETLGTMNSDITRLRQIMFNFLSNAAKFTNNGQITLTARRETDATGEILVFRISDTGIGMNAEQLSHIFKPFTQADTSTTRKYDGAGLGLTLNRQLAQLLGGEVNVESQPGIGTTFIVHLPAQAPFNEMTSIT